MTDELRAFEQHLKSEYFLLRKEVVWVSLAILGLTGFGSAWAGLRAGLNSTAAARIERELTELRDQAKGKLAEIEKAKEAANNSARAIGIVRLDGDKFILSKPLVVAGNTNDPTITTTVTHRGLVINRSDRAIASLTTSKELTGLNLYDSNYKHRVALFVQDVEGGKSACRLGLIRSTKGYYYWEVGADDTSHPSTMPLYVARE